MLENYRKKADPYISKIAKCFENTNPNTVSVLAFVCSVFALVAFILVRWNVYFLNLASLFIFLNGLFDVLDGKIARMSRKASARGDFLDHVLDRYADFFIIGGIALTGLCDPVIGLLGVVGVLFASYMGTQAQAVGCGRKYTGFLSRADRLIILILAPWIQCTLLTSPYPINFNLILTVHGYTHAFTFLELVMLFFAIMGHITAIQRFYITWKELYGKEKGINQAHPHRDRPAEEH
ncbi:MAG: CDP-alcohol phosphatidyltransferase family protein [Thermoplasmata archaeon]